MALVRILVDGYSLLHNWPDVAPGKARHSAIAREDLIHRLTQYHDATGTPLTIIFDGADVGSSRPATDSTPEVEILYSRTGQTADQLIERITHRMKSFGEVLVVTDDEAERNIVHGVGGSVSSCANFIQLVQGALAEMEREIKRHNQKEQNKFNHAD